MPSGTLETGLHLFQSPRFSSGDGRWHVCFRDAIAAGAPDLTYDVGAILGILSFGYTTGDRTLLREISRQPWLSRIDDLGKPELLPIPAHGTLWVDERQAAATLLERLRSEVMAVCAGRRQICILLSGGLDSRIVAGVVSQLQREGRISNDCTAVTWGVRNCRDVVYGEAAAKILEMRWQHIDLTPEHLVANVGLMARSLGCLATPENLHAMSWFAEVGRETLVLAGSYGDSVGRAEFSGRHVLELSHLSVTNPFGLMKPSVAAKGAREIKKDIAALHARTPGQPPHVLCEHEMQGFYMRNLIASVMAVISQYCSLYQVFTDPQVYGYMWSLHPSLRTDEIYGHLFEMLHPRLARLPWARTNRALQGATEGAVSGLSRSFQRYAEWTREYAYPRLANLVDDEWFAATGIFDAGRVRRLTEEVRENAASLASAGYEAYRLWLWLASLRVFVDWLAEQGRRVDLGFVPDSDSPRLETEHVPEQQAGLVRRVFREVPRFHGLVKRARRCLGRWNAVRRYPPTRQYKDGE